MSETFPETPNFGLTRVGEGESLSKNSYTALDGDRLTLDDLISALAQHNHSGTARLGNPATGPTLTAEDTGGQLPGGVTYYYSYSYLDTWGLESAVSPEVEVTTADFIEVPGPASLIPVTTGGTLPVGTYAYVYTIYVADGSETTPSDITSATFVSGTTNMVTLVFPELPAGSTGVKIYRSRPGQSEYYLIGTSAAGADFDDTDLVEDYAYIPPAFNSTNAVNQVIVTLPGEVVPDGVAAWRIYRTTTPGEYESNSLVHEVVETVDEEASALRFEWIDDGDQLLMGTPKVISSTIGNGRIIDLDAVTGSFPLSSMPRGGNVITAYIEGYSTYLPSAIRPLAVTAFYETAPTDPLTIDLTSADGTVTLDVADNAQYSELILPSILDATIPANTAVPSVTTAYFSDSFANAGVAAEFDEDTDSIAWDLWDYLSTGNYSFSIYYKKLVAGASTNDITVRLREVTNGNAVVASSSFTPSGTVGTYTTVSYTAGNTSRDYDTVGKWRLEIAKAVNSVNSWAVSHAVATATAGSAPTLSGYLSITPNGAGNMGARCNVSMWF
jgi:hypothetical protein